VNSGFTGIKGSSVVGKSGAGSDSDEQGETASSSDKAEEKPGEAPAQTGLDGQAVGEAASDKADGKPGEAPGSAEVKTKGEDSTVEIEKEAEDYDTFEPVIADAMRKADAYWLDISQKLVEVDDAVMADVHQKEKAELVRKAQEFMKEREAAAQKADSPEAMVDGTGTQKSAENSSDEKSANEEEASKKSAVEGESGKDEADKNKSGEDEAGEDEADEDEADGDMSGEDEADEDESDSDSNSILNALVDRVYTFAVKLAKQEPVKASSEDSKESSQKDVENALIEASAGICELFAKGSDATDEDYIRVARLVIEALKLNPPKPAGEKKKGEPNLVGEASDSEYPSSTWNTECIMDGLHKDDRLDQHGRIRAAAVAPLFAKLDKGNYDAKKAKKSGSLVLFRRISAAVRALVIETVPGTNGGVHHRTADRIVTQLLCQAAGYHFSNIDKFIEDCHDLLVYELGFDEPAKEETSYTRAWKGVDQLAIFRAIQAIITSSIMEVATLGGQTLGGPNIVSTDGKESNSSDYSKREYKGKKYNKDKEKLDMMNVYSYQLGYFTDHEKIPYKANEKWALIHLLANISKDALVTSDAGSTYIFVANAIIKHGNELLLAVKGNQSTQFEWSKAGIERHVDLIADELKKDYLKRGLPTDSVTPAKFKDMWTEAKTKAQAVRQAKKKNKKPERNVMATWDQCERPGSLAHVNPFTNHLLSLGCTNAQALPVPYLVVYLDAEKTSWISMKRTVNHSKGCIVIRDYVLLVDGNGAAPGWPTVCNIGCACQTTIPICNTKKNIVAETRYFLSSPTAVSKFAQGVRGHWQIEMGHFCLDVTFGDDDCRRSIKNGAEGFHCIKKLCMVMAKCAKAAQHMLSKSTASYINRIHSDGGVAALTLIAGVFDKDNYSVGEKKAA
jgi:predicted transposase YbfD/YdcC